MGSALQANDPTITAAFSSALRHQLLLVIAIALVVSLAWGYLRATQLRRAGGRTLPLTAYAEPLGRRVLRIGFGLLWVLDGVLQAQPAMPLGMTSQVIQPGAVGSPGWVQHLVASVSSVWNYHPVVAAAATVWIQAGIGIWLLMAARGRWSRLAGVAAAVWGLIVWVFGESFGGILAPGLTWLFGAPGAVLFYVLAGVLIALPERAWSSDRIGRLSTASMGVFFVGMAVLQAWPGRGFWQGSARHGGGTLTSMVHEMGATPQPHVFASMVSWFGRVVAAHGFATNLAVVVFLAVAGLSLVIGRPAAALRWAVVVTCIVALADWVLVEDLGFFGGVGTDPNSMIPMIVLLVGGYLALVSVPVTVNALEPTEQRAQPEPAGAPSGSRAEWWRGVRPADLLRTVAAAGCVGVVLVGAVPMGLASLNRTADPILTVSVDGAPQALDSPAPAFQLVDQRGQAVTLSSLRGKTIALTFIDPVCTTDCPVIAQELREAGSMLGADVADADLVAVVTNPIYRSVADVQAFDSEEGLASLHNWLFLTGSAATLKQVWSAYDVAALVEPGGSMVAHTDIVYIIDSRGDTRFVLNADPGPATGPTESSFSGLVASEMRQLIGSQ
jgi:cytochrome oxidase Cu insertion factor (SCO1/SenC/PrrC family)